MDAIAEILKRGAAETIMENALLKSRLPEPDDEPRWLVSTIAKNEEKGTKMKFNVKEVALGDIPERKTFGSEPTERSIWVQELLTQFVESKAGIWEICEGIDGPFKNSKETTSYASSIAAQTKKKRFKGIKSMQRGNRIFISKVRLSKVGE